MKIKTKIKMKQINTFLLGLGVFALGAVSAADPSCNLDQKPIFELPVGAVLRYSPTTAEGPISTGDHFRCDLKKHYSPGQTEGEFHLQAAAHVPELNDYAFLIFDDGVNKRRSLVLCAWKGKPVTVQGFIDGIQRPDVSIVIPNCTPN